jgi:hypothetical protein
LIIRIIFLQYFMPPKKAGRALPCHVPVFVSLEGPLGLALGELFIYIKWNTINDIGSPASLDPIQFAVASPATLCLGPDFNAVLSLATLVMSFAPSVGLCLTVY